MKMNTTGIISVFVWCIFMGVTAISIGFGAAFPPMNLIAKPFVCPSGRMYYDETSSNPLPGTTYTQIYWHCTDEAAGTTTDLDIFPMALYAGIIYGFLLFVVIMVVWYFNKRRDPSPGSTGDSNINRQFAPDNSSESPYYPVEDPFRGSAAEGEGSAAHAHFERMKELKQLHDTNIISQAEYEQKRAEILKDL